MASGYCSACGELQPVIAGEHRPGSARQRVWRPVRHARPDGTRCPGSKQEAGDYAHPLPPGVPDLERE